MDLSVTMMKHLTQTFATTMENVVKTIQPSKNDDVSGFLARQCSGTKDLPDFYGDPEDWTSFIQRYDSSTNLCRFSHDENLLRLQKCLKGKAREAVHAMLTAGCHPGEVIRILEKRFGRPELVFKRILEKVRYAAAPADGDWNGIVELSLGVKNLCATAKALQLKQYLTNPQLLDELKRKLPSSLQYDWGKFMLRLHRPADIKDFSNFLDEASDAAALVCDTLPNRRKQRDHGHVFIVKESSSCLLSCKDKHHLDSCPKFKKLDTDDRWEVIKKHKACFSCLGLNHQTLNCKKKKSCGQNGCYKKHHPLLHVAEQTPQVADNTSRDKPQSANTNTVYSQPEGAGKPDPKYCGIVASTPKPTCSPGTVLMKILPVELTTLDDPARKIVVNVMLDDGSTLTMMDTDFAKRIGLSGKVRPLHLAWQGDLDDVDYTSFPVQIKIRGINEDKEFLLDNVRTKRNLNLPVQPLSNYKLFRKWKHLENIPYPEVLDSRPVMVIGLDNLHLMIGRKFAEGPRNTPIASWTHLGWVIHGPCGIPYGAKYKHLSMINVESCDPDQALHELVKEQFRLESLGVVNCPSIPMSQSNKRADDMLERFSFKTNDRWTAPMLWKSDDLELPDNLAVARKRLHLIEKQMDKDEEFANVYCKKIEEYVMKGFCHKLTPEELNYQSKRTWYLPHFGTTNPNKPGKLRLVFDAASKFQGTSLNDALIQGRDLMSPLINVLLKFRQYEVAFSGDIRDMFHMIQIRQEDVFCQRFLWRGKGRSTTPDVYQMDAMVFGAVSSPYQAQWVKNRNAEDFKAGFPEAVEAIQNRHYVDDYLDSCSTPEEAIRKIIDVREIHRRGGFEIRGWQCSNPDVIKVVAPGEMQTNDVVLPGDDKLERVLGLHWIPKSDTFTFKTSFSKVDPALINGEKVPTKRQLLQLIMSLFDPLGFIGHVTARGRILLQVVWKSGVKWDEKLIGLAEEKWRQFIPQVRELSSVKIPRCLAPAISGAQDIQLHTFCDASQQAFGAVTFLRTVGTAGEVNVNIVLSKTRVTPIKCVSIPRLELEAALIGARQTNYVRTLLDLYINRTVLWTDSRNVVYWLRAEDPSRFKMYVSHRIGEILDLTNVSEWRWVPTADNVADDCTRDNCAADLSQTSRWFTGPSFLRKAEVEWPKLEESTHLAAKEDLEEKTVCMIAIAEDSHFPRAEDYSCLLRLTRITAWILRYSSNIRKKYEQMTLSKHLSVEELQAATDFWIRKVQRESFPEEIQCLEEGKNLDRHSKLINLMPVLENGIIRLKTRLVNAASMDYGVKMPPVLDRKHPWTVLVVNWFHRMHGHHGYDKICNEIRQSYWVLGVKNAVKKASRDCGECKLSRACRVFPQMAALPEFRTTRPPRAFTFVGVDYFGPLDIVNGRKHEKRYGVLFTCLSVRAVHLEVAHSLSTDEFLLALERFICTRGEPTEIWSDNGTNFKGAEKELKCLLDELDQDKLLNKLAIRSIKWNFIPPSSPHMGGAWERLVQSVKQAMYVVLKKRTLTEQLLSTVIAQAMAAVNNRPITAVSSDLEDQEALTPNTFLIGTSSIKQPPGYFTDDDLGSRKRWRVARQLSNHFWVRWTKEYLPGLSLRTKWRKDTPDIQVGEIVFVPDGNELTQQWKKGLVIAVYPGKDGHVRVVDIRTANGTMKRPVAKLLRMTDSMEDRDSNEFNHWEGHVPEENKPSSSGRVSAGISKEK